MQNRSRENNNPFNPLFKVSALEIQKIYPEIVKPTKANIKITLNFKKSEDLRGITSADDGSNVNVVFSLSIKRATLKLICSDDKGNSPQGLCKIEEVAYVPPLVISEKVNDQLSKDASLKKTRSFSISGAIKAGLDAINPTAATEVSAAMERSDSTANKREVARGFESLNVAATHAGHTVHWEIGPTNVQTGPAARDFLVGDLFVSATDGTQIDACLVERTDGKSVSNLVVTGSVMTSMRDLIIERISFSDDDGHAIEFANIKINKKTANTIKDAMRPEQAKDRLIKQIIRKHLVSQGLSSHGDLVEISKASA